MNPRVIIGIDFDNTIVSYDEIFYRVARERELIPELILANKNEVRNYLRRIGREEDWTEMQGYVYGARMLESQPFPGVLEFFQRSRANKVEIFIVSHKTQHPFRGKPYDLRGAAFEWLEHQGFFDQARIGLPRERVFFEPTKEAKLKRIRSCGCTHFVDDLPEFLAEPDFPKEVKTVLFDPNDSFSGEDRFVRLRKWTDAQTLLTC